MSIPTPGHLVDPVAVDALSAEYLFELSIDFDPMQIYPSPLGTRMVAVVRRGRATGPRLDAAVLAGGGDWLVVGSDSVARVDVRATLRTADGAMILLTSTGRASMDGVTRDRFLGGEAIRFEEMHGRTAPLFETGSDAYSWLNRTVAIGNVVELALDHIRYHVFAVR
ncbi:MAG TPA: DUF3237 domain-containing protein [Acidimicrobiales bacterium]